MEIYWVHAILFESSIHEMLIGVFYFIFRQMYKFPWGINLILDLSANKYLNKPKKPVPRGSGLNKILL